MIPGIAKLGSIQAAAEQKIAAQGGEWGVFLQGSQLPTWTAPSEATARALAKGFRAKVAFIPTTTSTGETK